MHRSPTRPAARRLRAAVLLLLALIALPLAACGSSSDDDGASTATTAGTSGADLSAVTLRVGDLGVRSQLEALLRASGELDGIPYELDWSIFPAGPALIAAQTSGSVDVGRMANTPPIFAQAAGQDVRIVATATPAKDETIGTAIIVAEDSPIRSVADLRGKKVGFPPSTIMEYLLVKLLEQEGLRYDDVKASPLQLPNGQSALQSGGIDALVTIDPFLGIARARGGIRVIASGDGVDPGVFVLTATGAALDDAAKEAAIADFVARVARADRWAVEHPDEWGAALAATLGLPPAIGEDIVSRSLIEWGPLDETVVEAQQDQADVFRGLGQIRREIDVEDGFDRRFDEQLESATNG